MGSKHRVITEFARAAEDPTEDRCWMVADSYLVEGPAGPIHITEGRTIVSGEFPILVTITGGCQAKSGEENNGDSIAFLEEMLDLKLTVLATEANTARPSWICHAVSQQAAVPLQRYIPALVDPEWFESLSTRNSEHPLVMAARAVCQCGRNTDRPFTSEEGESPICPACRQGNRHPNQQQAA